MDFLLNEESRYCILHESFKNYHIGLLEDFEPSTEDIRNAESVLKRANKPASIVEATSNTNDVKNANANTGQSNGFMDIKW
jgi:hypothetical protein